MPLGLVSDEDFISEVDSLSGKNPTLQVQTIKEGRGLGNNEVPHQLREVLAEESILGGRTSGVEMAKMFGISAGAVDAYKRGDVTQNKDSQRTKVTARDRIADGAIDKVDIALRYITAERLAAIEDVKDVTAVAKDLAHIADKLSPVVRDKNNGDNKTLVVIHAPAMRSVDDYEIVDSTVVEKVS